MSLEQEFRDHVLYTQQRFREMDERIDHIQQMQAENARQMAELIASVKALTTRTSGVVEAYESIRGAAKVGVALQDICIWLAKWGVLGTAAAAGLKWVLDHSPSP